MQKKTKWKNVIEFLNTDYPENLLPIKKLPAKYEKKIQEKKNFLRKIKKRIEETEKNILNTESSVLIKKQTKIDIQNIRLLFSSDQLKNEILKKQTQFKRFSDFLIKLKEKKKFSIIYGKISKKFFEKAYNRAKRRRGKINENLLLEFESRLDVILYRIAFCKNISIARQYITHNMILINGKIINIPSYQVKPGDIISINKKKQKQLVSYLLNFLKTNLYKRYSNSFVSNPLISNKNLQKFVEKNNDLQKLIRKLKKKLAFLYINSVFLQKNLAEQKKKFLFEKQIYKKKKIALLEGLIKITSISQRLIKSKKKLKKDILKYKILLILKRSFFRKRPQRTNVKALRFSSMKPMHAEVSYKLLTAVILYSPQKLNYPTIINTDILTRAFYR